MTLFGVLRPHRTLEVASRLLASRQRAAHARPREAQEKVLAKVVGLYRDTDLGRGMGIDKVRSVDDLQRVVPVTQKSDYAPWALRLRTENPPRLVSMKPLRYVAATSGTTGEVQHFPFPQVLIETFRAFQWEIMLHLMRQLGHYSLLDANILVTAPAASYETLPSGIVAGKATAIMTQLTPKIARGLVRPSHEILAMGDVTEKLHATVADALPRDIRLLMGVPLGVLPLFERLVAAANAKDARIATLADVWPNLRAYAYSGAALGSLAPRLRELLGPNIPFFEMYSASESPVAYQYRLGEPGMLLDLRHCFFEFQHAEEPLDAPRFTVDRVETRTPYRILMTTVGGRFVYRLGDNVEFLGIRPYVLRILGREQEELNLGYERIPLHVVRAALEAASKEQGARIHNFFVCPTPTAGAQPAHEWHIEFAEAPPSAEAFAAAIDRALHAAHGRYAFARKDDQMLRAPSVVPMPRGTIEKFVLAKREYGLGKFPPVYNTREPAGPVLDFAANAAGGAGALPRAEA